MHESALIAQFLRDVAQHRVYIERDDGLYRHLRFRETREDGSTSYCMGFDIVTWPGWLAYSGDMGSFMFQRTPDMLAFFRKEERGGRSLFDGIDRRYWAEKCHAEGVRGDGIKEFDADKFKTEVKRRAEAAMRHTRAREKLTADERNEFLERVNDDVVDRVDDWPPAAHLMVYDFSYSKGSVFSEDYETFGIDMDEFPSCETYTQRFNWCCCALAWGIDQYDKAKAAAQPAAVEAHPV